MYEIYGGNMLYLKRKADEYLEIWRKSQDKKPLIIKGARQVGKSETIRRFGQKNYESFVEINFALNPELKIITSQGYTVENIIKQISLLYPSFKLIPGRTLLFFDEVQEHPDIVTSFKSFKEDNRYNVIASGSMLGISNIDKISSIPTGNKTDYIMRSLDFEEFLWAYGYKEDFIDEIFKNIKSHSPFSEAVMEVMNKKFTEYYILGGMPEIVRNFFERKSFEGTLEKQKQLMEEYKDDARKYAVGMDKARIVNVLEYIPSQLAKENTKFQITKVAKGARFQTYRGCLEWLKDVGIINICHALSKPAFPIKNNYEPDKCKIYFADTGLLMGQLGSQIQNALLSGKDIGRFKGGLFENIIGEALVKAGFELVYFKRDKTPLEEDFFVECSNQIVPVEVKANTEQSKSLRTLIDSDKYPEITWGIKFAKANVGFANSILTLPHWTAFLLDRLINIMVKKQS